MNFTVGYHANLRGWFTATQFAALEAGRRHAQERWSTAGNITWSGSASPRITIKPALDETAWARAPINGTWIAISVNEKFRYSWENEAMWRSLFLHEYGHSLGLPDTKEPGHAMTIFGVRAESPSPSEVAWMTRRYGAPKVPPTPPPQTTLAIKGTAGRPDVLDFEIVDNRPTVSLNSVPQSIPSTVSLITFDGISGDSVAFLRGQDVIFTATDRGATFQAAGYTVTTTNTRTHHAYATTGSATLRSNVQGARLKLDTEQSTLDGPAFYHRAKGFTTVKGVLAKPGTLVIPKGIDAAIVPKDRPLAITYPPLTITTE
jgi:hypothetical protein